MSIALFTNPTMTLASDARRWEDEIVYVVIIEKFFNGDPANDIMRERFSRGTRTLPGWLLGRRLEGRDRQAR